MAQKTRPVNLAEETQKRGLKVLERDFPPGTNAWAFWSALAGAAMDLWEKGDLELLRMRKPGAVRAAARNRSDRPRHAPLSAPEPLLAGSTANGHSEHGEAHSG